ncbi:YafY family protein [Maritimibacter sp. UBA3975]|uniref:helix-turn-helix transcriptional regulator n=1 Tax=Maritimibacter sp. UBA3975 TaxID=1946833 RepID=UPI000C09BEA3|nr:YafY family protein [Maritimibacter sp. UBA3975]MAM63299.1 transcriptional regulator [Maritimibacter sp.]|tara:strand:- start:45816 stop:46499 length:684 start_codon:yes stop_codon:yes gene_type:complete
MARTDRLFRLLDALRRLPAPVTATRLAEETGVSERTIYRDIDSLRAAGALIDGAAGYGYTLTEDSAVPPQMFDRLELEAVVLGLSWLGLQGDPALADAAERALAKVTASLPARKAEEAKHVALLAYAFETKPEVPEFMATLREAAWDERAVEIDYTDRNGAHTQRRIWPLSIVYTDYAPWILAWCCKRRDFRRFLISRVARVTATQESFRPRRVPLLREMMAQSYTG